MIKNKNNKTTQAFPLINPSRFVLIDETVQTHAKFELGVTDSQTPLDQQTQDNDKIFTVLISGGIVNPVTIIIRKYQYGDAVAK